MMRYTIFENYFFVAATRFSYIYFSWHFLSIISTSHLNPLSISLMEDMDASLKQPVCSHLVRVPEQAARRARLSN